MGLAARTTKVKIADDPRNTRWAADTDAPGFKMLAAMGWTPGSTTLQKYDKPVLSTSKRLTRVPAAGQTETLGLGASKASASSIFSTFGSKGLKFVTAMTDGTAEALAAKARATEGKDFASLLARLNASASASPAPDSANEASGADTPAEAEPKRKKRRKAVEAEAADAKVNAVVEEPVASTSSAPVVAAVPSRFNPRNASRSRHLASKRLATSSAADMAGILGIVVVPSPAASSAPSQAPTPVAARSPSPAPVEAAVAAASTEPETDAAAAKAARKAARKLRKAERAAAEAQPAAEPAPAAPPSKKRRKDVA